MVRLYVNLPSYEVELDYNGVFNLIAEYFKNEEDMFDIKDFLESDNHFEFKDYFHNNLDFEDIEPFILSWRLIPPTSIKDQWNDCEIFITMKTEDCF